MTTKQQQLVESRRRWIMLCAFMSILIIFITSFIIPINLIAIQGDIIYKQGYKDRLNNCQNEKEIWIIEKPIDLATNTIIGATAYKLNNSNILCNMFNEGCMKK